MEKNMEDRLIASKNRIQEIDDLLLKEDTSKDMKLFKSLSKERSDLEPIVEKYNEYKLAEKNKQDALVMANDSDPEIAAMGKDEIKNNDALMEKIIDELRILLIPKDPNDGKDIIF